MIYELKAGGVDERRLVGAKLEKLAEGDTGTWVLHKQVVHLELAVDYWPSTTVY